MAAMPDYDFTACLSPLDFELLSKDLLEAEIGIQLENFSEGRDKGIDLRYAPIRGTRRQVFNLASMNMQREPPTLIVQCKRYSEFSDLKSTLKNKELAKIQDLKPTRYVLTTSVSLSPQQSKEIKSLLSPFVQSTGDIYGRERLNSLLAKHPEIERRHIKLWVASAGVLDSIINAKIHLVSREEVERTLAAAKIYVQNTSFEEALAILKKHRVCIISGLPGIGKTTLARMLLLYFYKRKFDVVKKSPAIYPKHAPSVTTIDLGSTTTTTSLGKRHKRTSSTRTKISACWISWQAFGIQRSRCLS
jgi:cell division FtsZ-interacting protein ZapD